MCRAAHAGCYSPNALVIVEGAAAPVRLRDVAVGDKVLGSETNIDWTRPTSLKYFTLVSFVSTSLRPPPACTDCGDSLRNATSLRAADAPA